MKVSVQCPHCGTAYRVAEEKLGYAAHCKRCSQTFTLTVSGAADETFNGRAIPADSAPEPAEQYASPPGESPDVSSPGASEEAKSPATGAQADRSWTIGPYLVQRKLGAGMMGEVWLAHDPQLDRDVAIKLLPASFAKDAERLKRFLREARATARLDHSNVVTVYQAGTDGERVFIAMQYVDGGSLDKAVAAGGPPSWREATQVIREAAAGLSAAHAQGLVHRDVKPANLMRTTTGVTKVVDFGLVRSQASDSNMTQDGRLLGTPAYMAPEQWTGGEVDVRSDLYSLVCTYYYLLTGHVPFDAPNAPSLGYQHRYESPPDPRELAGVLPDGVCRILGRGMSKDPTQRYQSAEELIAALDAVLAAPQESLTFQAPWQQLSNPYGIVAPPVVLKIREKGDNRRTAFWNVMVATIPFVALVVALGVILNLQTPDGTLVVEVNEPDAMVQVLNKEGKVEITRQSGNGKLTISVDPGKHRLKVEKDGFQLFTKQFSIESGGTMKIAASLQPVKDKAQSADAPPERQERADKEQGDAIFSDRQVAQWALEIGGDVSVVVGDQIHTVKTTDLLPDGDFRIVGLGLLGTQANDVDLGKLSGLTRLERLSLDYCPVTGAGLEPLSRLTQLSYLSLNGTELGDTGLTHLKGLEHLKDLWLTRTQVTDTGVEHLKGLTHLTDLFLTETQITDAGVKQLREALPKCKITWSAPPGQSAGPAVPTTRQAPAMAVAPFDEQAARGHQLAWAEYLGVPAELQNTIGMRLVLIPPGEFQMGSPATEEGRDGDEQQHRVRITKPFYLGVHEVTQEQYEGVMGTNPSEFEGPQKPVTNVSWDDAVTFCRRLTALPEEKAEGREYRLPTEAEWEYACRAGTTTRYSFGDNPAGLGDYAWSYENSSATTHCVGEKRPNSWGLYDMHGNV